MLPRAMIHQDPDGSRQTRWSHDRGVRRFFQLIQPGRSSTPGAALVQGELQASESVGLASPSTRRNAMGFGRGALLWLLGIPLPIILLLALFWR